MITHGKYLGKGGCLLTACESASLYIPYGNQHREFLKSGKSIYFKSSSTIHEHIPKGHLTTEVLAHLCSLLLCL